MGAAAFGARRSECDLGAGGPVYGMNLECASTRDELKVLKEVAIAAAVAEVLQNGNGRLIWTTSLWPRNKEWQIL